MRCTTSASVASSTESAAWRWRWSRPPGWRSRCRQVVVPLPGMSSSTWATGSTRACANADPRVTGPRLVLPPADRHAQLCVVTRYAQWAEENVRGQDPLSGQLFVFINRRATQMKALYFDRGGYCVWAKRLEQGQFHPMGATPQAGVQYRHRDLPGLWRASRAHRLHQRSGGDQEDPRPRDGQGRSRGTQAVVREPGATWLV